MCSCFLVSPACNILIRSQTVQTPRRLHSGIDRLVRKSGDMGGGGDEGEEGVIPNTKQRQHGYVCKHGELYNKCNALRGK